MFRFIVCASVTELATASKSATLSVGGFVGGGSQKALVVYPSDASASTTYPLISFAHGDGVAPSLYENTLLSAVADRGYIVLSPNSCINAGGGAAGWCNNFFEDQQHVINWARKNPGAHPSMSAIDWTKKAGLLGHSMGGMMTLKCASDGSLGAAVAMNPFDDGFSNPAPSIKIPTMYVTGESDQIAYAQYVKAFYEKTPNSASKIIIDVTSGSHNSFWADTSFDQYAAAFFDCHLKGVEGDCGVIYTKQTQGGAYAVCNNPYYSMTECKYHRASDSVNETAAVMV